MSRIRPMEGLDFPCVEANRDLMRQIIGAAGGDRTHDPWLRRPILYPLSYSRNVAQQAIVEGWL